MLKATIGFLILLLVLVTLTAATAKATEVVTIDPDLASCVEETLIEGEDSDVDESEAIEYCKRID